MFKGDFFYKPSNIMTSTTNTPTANTNLWQVVWETPWRATNELRRVIAMPYIRMMFRLHGVLWGRGWRIFGMPMIQRYRGSRIELGDGLTLRSWYVSAPLPPRHPVVLATLKPDAVVQIGRDCGFNGTALVAAERIEIGDRVSVGANSIIVDTDFHPLDPIERQYDFRAGRHAVVIIEDDVFIGTQSLILKGVRIGRGSVVGAGSVVTRDVPPGVIVAGNPAQILKDKV
jgi:acetyltransferase-like isoleucine patch superfamily enzyme